MQCLILLAIAHSLCKVLSTCLLEWMSVLIDLAHLMKLEDSVVQFRFVKSGQVLEASRACEMGARMISGAVLENSLAPIAFVPETNAEFVSLMLGAVAIGCPVVSIPLPPRGMDADWYRGFVTNLCTSAGVSVLFLDDSLKRRLGDISGVRTVAYEDAYRLKGPIQVRSSVFEIVQFSSGSTAFPKGIPLGSKQLVANLRAIVDWLEPGNGDNACSWLPMSHDMGLVGILFGSLASASLGGCKSFELTLLSPREFIMRPHSWLEACAQFGSSITSAPTFGYEVATKARYGEIDLTRLRICIVGAEPVRPAVLSAFSERFRESGLSSSALCPAYGLAEVGVAVTGDPVAEKWTAISAKNFSDLDMGGTFQQDLVSCGMELMDYEVEVEGGGLGEISVRGPSLATAYSNGDPVKGENGWFATGDIGFVKNGRLYVVGRKDDMFQVAGRNVHPTDLEFFAGQVVGVSSQRVAVLYKDRSLSVIAECAERLANCDDAATMAQSIERVSALRLGIRPDRVWLVRRGALPLTASGKIRRSAIHELIAAGQIIPLPGSIG